MTEFRLEDWLVVPGNRLKGKHFNEDHTGTWGITSVLKLPLDEVELEPDDVVYDKHGSKYVLGRKLDPKDLGYKTY